MSATSKTLPNDQAFPSEVYGAGLTIREHFAAMAMQAIIGTAAGPCLAGFGGCESVIATTAVGMADALIAGLNKRAQDEGRAREETYA